MLEGREFSIYTDQRSLTDAFKQKSDKCSPRQLRHLDFISQFSTYIRYVKGSENIVADALSRIEIHILLNLIEIQRHIKSPIGTFSLPDARFAHINIDLIGPLPPSDGYTYYMTIIDRFTRWPKVIPTKDITAETTSKALIHNWIPRFGCPVTITTDQGRNFDSHLFRHLNDILGTNRIRTTSYHPLSNGLVERFTGI
ncbi:hypothetical protein AVEN_59753-1 [Araneus ventricosus]|uniref:Integrase catalytic domain-containing protein n=1 Tax=Araneus ventricosus TaxID=182803 RepID=A0A4Y2BQL9_ARAVE|nr:hypothetical protein AVEN_59753-1 [Araneus ventricosus]